MLLHLRPRLYSPYKNVVLMDLEFSFGLRLTGGKELATRRPYPNKRYAVACRRTSHKAIDGILVETGSLTEQFRCTARWVVEKSLWVEHRVDYHVLDHDFDAASDDKMLWHACSEDLGSWSNRVPENKCGIARLTTEPVMEVIPVGGKRTSEDVTDELGFITSRHEMFDMPTIERGRILESKLNDRLPRIDAVFGLG